jgi:hypothetical protein
MIRQERTLRTLSECSESRGLSVPAQRSGREPEAGTLGAAGVTPQPRKPNSSSLPTGQAKRVIFLTHWNVLPPPLFVLAPPRSFTSLVCAMLGQHPEMYGLPETHLFCDETVGARVQRAAQSNYPMGHGLLRVVGELYFGGQTESTIRKARRWLGLRSQLSTDFLFKVLADKVYPLILVDKSPSVVYSVEVLQRMRKKFPAARFIHLLRHPRGHGESVMKYIGERSKYGPIPSTHWLYEISSFPPPSSLDGVTQREGRVLDPQNGWYALNRNICEFLDSVPTDHKMRIRGEDLVNNPDEGLREIAAWIGRRADAEAIEKMKHPERSPFAFLGPPGGRYGNDAFFLANPALRSDRAAPQSLDGALSWRADGQGFLPEVRQLAQQFGYK